MFLFKVVCLFVLFVCFGVFLFLVCGFLTAMIRFPSQSSTNKMVFCTSWSNCLQTQDRINHGVFNS